MDSNNLIRFYDRNYHLLGVEDDAESIYTSRWSSYGSFELFLKEMHPGVAKGNRIIMDKDGLKNGIITYIHQDMDRITVRGYSLLWLMGHRITVPKTGKAHLTYNGPVEDVLYGLVKDCATNAEDSRRNFPHLVCAASQHRGPTYKYQTRYDNLLNCLQEISTFTKVGIGIRVVPEEAKEIFEVRLGTDKSQEQSTNPQVVFRQSYDNILRETYTLNTEGYKNCAYVGGQGEGTKRTIVKLGDENTGEDRKEIFVDARDIENADDLTDRGNTKLAECGEEESFEVDADSEDYKRRWDLGDKVTVIGEESGAVVSDYVTQIIETQDETGTSVVPVFGNAEAGIGGAAGGVAGVMDYFNPFEAASTLATTTDLNNITEPGIYGLWGEYTNGPADKVYGFMPVQKYHSTYRLQTIVNVSSSNSIVHIYVRRRTGSEWGTWNTIL